MKMLYFVRNKMYGGAEFVILDTTKQEWVEGCSRSTSINYRGDVLIELKTLKELKSLKTQLSIFQDEFKYLGRK